MEDWKQGYEIVYKKFCKRMQESGGKASQLAFARFVGASQGKVKAWQSGQWPLAPDLAVLAERLDLNPMWLLTGKGEPDASGATDTSLDAPLRNAAGQFVGHLLHDVIKGELGLTPEQFATASGVGLAALEQLLNGRCLPTWRELEAMDRAFGVNPHFLLTGRGPDVFPADEMERFCRATGTAANSFALNEALGIPLEDAVRELDKREQGKARRLEWLMEHPGDTDHAPMLAPLPEAWRAEARARYGMAAAWLAGDENAPSHNPAPDPVLARLDGIIARLKAHGGTDEQVQGVITVFVGSAAEEQLRDKSSRSGHAKTARLSTTSE